MPKKLKAAKPLKTPEYKDPQRIVAGALRVTAAREHLAQARGQLDAACRDLCDVMGASDFYREISKASDTARDVGYMLKDGVEAQAFAACGNIEGDKKHRSCGGAT